MAFAVVNGGRIKRLAILAPMVVLSTRSQAFFSNGKFDTSPETHHGVLQIVLWLLGGAFMITYSLLFWFSDKFAEWEFYRYSDRNAGLRFLAGGDLARGLWIGRWIGCPFMLVVGIFAIYLVLSWWHLVPGI